MYEMRRFLASDHQARLLAEADERRLARALTARRVRPAHAPATRGARVTTYLTSVSEALDTSGHGFSPQPRGTRPGP